MSDTKISEATLEAAWTARAHALASAEVIRPDWMRAALAAALPQLHPQPAELAEQQGGALAHALEVLRVVTGRAMQGSETRLAYETVRAALAHQQSAGQVVGHVSRDSSKAHMCVNLPEGSPLYALAATGKQQVGEVQGDGLATIIAALEHSKPTHDHYPEPVKRHADALAHARALAARQPGAQVPVNWPNECRFTVPAALRWLANHPRPVGGEDRFNSLHLLQLAGEIESMASQPLYAAPPAQGIDLGQVREIRIPARNKLDPISVFVQDQAAGRGRIVVTCYGNAWQAFWGAMGDRTVMEFVAQCDADYVAGNMLQGRQTRIAKHEREYAARVAAEVISEFRALAGQGDAAPGVGS